MPESEESKRDKFRFIIYHGHIHIFPKCEKIEDNDKINKIENPSDLIISKV